jgi:predicted nucleic acid-binding protein
MLFNTENATTDELLAYAYSQRPDDALVAALCKRLEIANETLDALGELPETTGEPCEH